MLRIVSILINVSLPFFLFSIFSFAFLVFLFPFSFSYISFAPVLFFSPSSLFAAATIAGPPLPRVLGRSPWPRRLHTSSSLAQRSAPWERPTSMAPCLPDEVVYCSARGGRDSIVQAASPSPAFHHHPRRTRHHPPPSLPPTKLAATPPVRSRTAFSSSLPPVAAYQMSGPGRPAALPHRLALRLPTHLPRRPPPPNPSLDPTAIGTTSTQNL